MRGASVRVRVSVRVTWATVWGGGGGGGEGGGRGAGAVDPRGAGYRGPLKCATAPHP